MNSGMVVRSVWADNFEAEKAVFLSVAPRAMHVALSVQYPGSPVPQPGGAARKSYGQLTAKERYDVVRANVDALKPIQIGLAIRTGDGELFVFEFNVRGFDISSPADLRDTKSIDHLASRGIDFSRLPHGGVDGRKLSSALRDYCHLLPARPSWVTFTGAYHVAYLMKMLTGGAKLPADLDAFVELVTFHLGSAVYDVKQLASKHSPACARSLKELTVILGVAPVEQEGGVVAGAVAVQALGAFEVLSGMLGERNMEQHRHMLCGLQAY